MYRKFLILIVCAFLILCTISNADNIDTEEDLEEQEIIQTVSKTLNEELVINSKIAIAYDRASNRVVWGKDENKKTAMASTTKIMTAIVTLENANLKDIVTVSSKAHWTGGSSLDLKTGDKVILNDLLYGLMLRSGNDAAVAIAEHVGGSLEGFADLMNKKAEELGLESTHFVTPHGLDDPEHYTTAKELAIITDYAMQNSKFCEIVGIKSTTISINKSIRTISNTNELLGVLNGVTGVKTGFTNNAGRCLVTSVNRNGWDIIVIVIRADTKKIRTQDSIKLIEYVYKNYQQVNIGRIVKEKFEEWCKINVGQISINKAVKSSIYLELSALGNDVIPVKKTEVDNIDVEINSLFYFEAPVVKGSIFGNLKVLLNEEVVDLLEIRNMNTINKKGIKNYFIEFFQNL